MRRPFIEPMLASQKDPIVAIATAPGRGAVGMVRISGRNLLAMMRAICGRELKPRVASYLPFLDESGQAIDRGIALYFTAPNSFTGEDVLELQAHGGAVVLQLLLARCLQASMEFEGGAQEPRLVGLRVAQAGEFTQRAFLNNKMDLAQAEAVSDLIDASTERAARSAVRSMTGAFSKEVHALKNQLIALRMLVEATLDFPEEEIDFLQKADAQGQLDRLLKKTEQVFGQTKQGALLRDGIKVVIVGQPNAGKSSLLNALAGAELAIVTPVAGTTRDKVQQTIQIEGVPIHIVDTAGLRSSQDEVEQVGIARAWEAIKDADVVLFLHDLTREQAADYRAADHAIAQSLDAAIGKHVPVMHVWNKADAAPPRGTLNGLSLSAKTGIGLEALRQVLLQSAGWQAPEGGIFMARERHTKALRRVEKHLTEARAQLQTASPALDLMAEELRLAQNALAEITGEFSSDDLLGAIFSKFCIGK